MAVSAAVPVDAKGRQTEEWIPEPMSLKETTAEDGAMLQRGLEEVLPACVLAEVMNRVRDGRDLARCNVVSKSMQLAVQHVQSLQLVCLNRHYHLVRKLNPINSDDGDDEDEDDDCCGMQDASGKSCEDAEEDDVVSFKVAVTTMLQRMRNLEQLRMEIEPEMQANPFQKEEIYLWDFWLSEPSFVRKWVQPIKHSLQHLCVVDYGQQAIMRPTPILRILTENCKGLKTLELRNMFLDTSGCQVLPQAKSLTLRCIKMMEKSLMDINECMPALETLALVSVFGVQEARLTSQHLKVLCLGLSTKAKTVDLDLPNVVKLQLKMACPDSLKVCAPNLAYIAVCMEKREGAKVEFEQVTNLKELLFGASHFSTLSKLIKGNPYLEKVFLDVPCMALGDDGKWEGVMRQVPLSLPDVKALELSCPGLHTLSVGPGLWHAMESDFESDHELSMVQKWPELKRLIVHMIVQRLETCLSVLRLLTSALPTLQTLEIYVHSDSPVEPVHFLSGCRQEQLSHTEFKSGTWKKSLCFACFSF